MADKSFKKLISTLESNKGRNIAHVPMEEGIHAGTTAMGEYGLMPNTAQELANRNILQGTASYKDKLIKDSNPEEITEIIKDDPELKEQYINQLMDKVLTKTQDDPTLGAVAWRYGHNLPMDKLKQLLKSNPGYEQRINEAIMRNHLMSEDESPLNKLLKGTLSNK